MQYKILICGKFTTLIDDFFSQLSEDFEIQSSSTRYDDLVSHLQYFQPDALVFCMQKETDAAIKSIKKLLKEIQKKDIILVAIGKDEAYNLVQNENFNVKNFLYLKPQFIKTIGENIKEHIEKWKQKNDIDEKYSAMGLKTIETPEIPEELYDIDFLKKEMDSELVRKHILVVDDDPIMLKLIKEQLRDRYSVATAISGSIALNFLERKNVDLVILDYEMPNENGADVLKKIRENQKTADIPVIFLTGVKERQKIVKLVQLKPQGYLLKPIEREKLLSTIEDTIG